MNILFRGKRLDNGEWVEGFYAPLITNWKKIIPSIRNFNGSDNPIQPNTLSQDTGLTDKNGNKIFAGDIVRLESGFFDTSTFAMRINDDEKYEVVWEEGAGRFVLDVADKTWTFRNLCMCQLMKHKTELVGNKWDNPELLEGKNGKDN